MNFSISARAFFFESLSDWFVVTSTKSWGRAFLMLSQMEVLSTLMVKQTIGSGHSFATHASRWHDRRLTSSCCSWRQHEQGSLQSLLEFLGGVLYLGLVVLVCSWIGFWLGLGKQRKHGLHSSAVTTTHCNTGLFIDSSSSLRSMMFASLTVTLVEDFRLNHLRVLGRHTLPFQDKVRCVCVISLSHSVVGWPAITGAGGWSSPPLIPCLV